MMPSPMKPIFLMVDTPFPSGGLLDEERLERFSH
jgi:hypothetical protein